MIVLRFKAQCQPDRIEEALAAFRDVVAASRDIEGVISFDIAQDLTDPNSIIAVEGDGPVEDGDDVVVKYSSAHIAPVESELIVKSNHSTQGNPHTIEEVRRILRLQASLDPSGSLHKTKE